MSLRTFQRDIQEIMTLYNIEIVYDRSRKVYKIDYDYHDDYQDRMFEALDIYQAMNLDHSYSEVMQFDARGAKGTEYLADLLPAIQKRRQIRFRYKKFNSKKLETRLIEPYLLREFRLRWYLLGYDTEKNAFRTFGLDRIYGLDVLSNGFQHPQDVKPDSFLENSFGIISTGNKKPRTIILEFYKHQGDYIRTQPLHSTQRILEDKRGTMVVQLELVPTFDFIQELMLHGEFLKIIKPKTLVNTVKSNFEKALKNYQ